MTVRIAAVQAHVPAVTFFGFCANIDRDLIDAQFRTVDDFRVEGPNSFSTQHCSHFPGLENSLKNPQF
jgi:hypothetical protein